VTAKRPIIISSVERIPATPEQERKILDLLAAAHEASRRKRLTACQNILTVRQ
jgi:hypothetical protein